MTKYLYTLQLGDSTMIALVEALKMYEKHCAEQLARGQKCPYQSHHQSIKHIQSNLYNNTQQISGNSFGGSDLIEEVT